MLLDLGSQDLDVYDQIKHLIDGNDEYSFKDNVSEMKWHRNCYSSFTSVFYFNPSFTKGGVGGGGGVIVINAH